ncbi:MAG: glycosyltransferase family 2 protein [Candidatus Magnetobacterium sp. LHC-1]|uniref:Glycosyltransferase family 2 protein n=1 Tax=Candidatus Magnetobacterium casense TaxID=1455061 RepID=A0ABS6S3S3_9BACT|nr:glycosyltransferase family 2 protein [Candidatus Magnetobacterium casensis]MBV6343502.1 glycosyltransferase family 2 protein [Candidatus Magnetobacterium casensis]
MHRCADASILVVLPAYNEQDNIATVIDKIRAASIAHDILVVDDGSTDSTQLIATDKGVEVIRHTINLGYGGALQTGFRFAIDKGYDYVVTLDADGQHDPKYICNLFDAMQENAANVVIGSRIIDGAYKRGLARGIGTVVFSAITMLYTGKRFTDPTSGFQLLDKSVLSYLSKGDNYPLDYPDANIIMLLHKNRFTVVETPVRMYERLRGKSMHSGLKPIMYVIRMLLSIVMVIIRRD